MNCIFYLDAPAGAGKSYTMLNAAAKSDEQILIVVPSLRLSDEIFSHLKRLDPSLAIEVINSSGHQSVVKAIMATLKQPSKGGRFVIITWSAFERLPYFPNRMKWNVFIDEIPQVVFEETANVPTTHVHLTDHIDIRPVGAAYGRVLTKSKSGLERIVSAQDDALQGKLTSMARNILSPYHRSYVHMTRYNSLRMGMGRQISLYSVLKYRIFHGFKRVTILGANFRKSLLYMIWSSQGVIFKEDTALADKLRYQAHPDAPYLKIYFGFTRPWSKTMRDRDDKSLLKALVQASVDLMAGERFIWAANKDVPDTTISQENAVRLPQVAHGLNEFSTVHNVVYLSACNPSPGQIAFLAWLGVDEADLRKAIHEEVLYQSGARSSLRDPNCKAPRRFVVPDHGSALYLQKLFPGSKVVKLDLGVDDPGPARSRGRKKTFDNTAARVRAHRQKQAQARSHLAAMMAGEITTTLEEVDLSMAFGPMTKPCNENTYKEGQKNVTPNLMGSLFNHVKATHPTAVVPNVGPDAFIKALKECHKKEYANKSDNTLICPSVFDASQSKQSGRGLKNVVYANGIWLDIDSGNMTHKNFSKEFPQLRMVFFNSFSSTRSQPRYRFFIPTSRTMDADEYSSISRQIVQKIENEGYVTSLVTGHRVRRCHGIDKSKLHAASMFFLPCQPADKSGLIWKEYKGHGRTPLDVDDWLEHALPNTIAIDDVDCRMEDNENGDEPIVNLAQVEAAKERWYTVGILKGNGDREMYYLAMELKRSGLSVHDSKIILEEAARSATSPQDRRQQVKSIMDKYTKFWHA